MASLESWKNKQSTWRVSGELLGNSYLMHAASKAIVLNSEQLKNSNNKGNYITTFFRIEAN
jgi:hypothetical protein